jgi:UDP-N-acetyl-2-amino-2-deoxyglucuronate dehydrogenase
MIKKITKISNGVNKQKKRKIKFGLIGCGRISAQHFSVIKAITEIELRAVCDIKEDRAKEVAKKYKVDWYKDYRELLKRNDIDLVSICTPNGLHVPIGIDAAKEGKDVVMEKPLGINLREVDRLLNYFKKAKRKLFAVLQVRFNPSAQTVKKIIEENKLGRINSVALVVRWQRPQKYFDQDEWRGTKRLDGGTLLNQGIHYVDLLQWLLGPVKSVFAKKDTIAHQIEIEDIAIALLKFKSGAYATLEFTICTYPKNLECSISILGSKGTIKIGGLAANELEIWEVEKLPRPVLSSCLPPNVYAKGLYQGSCPNHIFVYQNIVKYYKGDKSAFVTNGYEARKSLEIVEAIYRSAEKDKEIFLPLKSN